MSNQRTAQELAARLRNLADGKEVIWLAKE